LARKIAGQTLFIFWPNSGASKSLRTRGLRQKKGGGGGGRKLQKLSLILQLNLVRRKLGSLNYGAKFISSKCDIYNVHLYFIEFKNDLQIYRISTCYAVGLKDIKHNIDHVL
jgi:hypothetical protein